MGQYYDFSFSLQPPVLSPAQRFFAQILCTQAESIAHNLTHTTDSVPHTSLDSPLDSPQVPIIFESNFYTSTDFARDSKPTLHFIIHTNHAPAVLEFADSLSQILPLSLNFCFLTLSLLDSLESLQPLTLPAYTPHTHFCTARSRYRVPLRTQRGLSLILPPYSNPSNPSSTHSSTPLEDLKNAPSRPPKILIAPRLCA